jgi:multiple sugar transport system permease protein
MMRQFFLQIPFELSESAYIDGASEYRTFFQIILPLAKPAIVSIIIINFTWHWNDFQNPLIFLRSQKLFTIPLGLNFFAEENDTQLELVATASVLSSLPMIIVFVIAQRHFITGLTAGGIKG